MNAEKIGKFISSLRKEKGMTQAVLAEKLNVSNRTISKWENGDGFPDITILPEVAGVLDVTVDELLSGEKTVKKVADIKVTEVANKDNLDNLFLISYIVSLFIGIFGALLGGFYELYSIWAFRWLFYNHWEIIFVAVSLFCTIISGLIFSVGVARLGVYYSKEEIKDKVMKKASILATILSVFPIAFLARLFDCFVFSVPYYSMLLACFIIFMVLPVISYLKFFRKK